MAKKNTKKKKKSSGSAEVKITEPTSVVNPELKEILKQAGSDNSPETQMRLAAALRSAKLLVPAKTETVMLQSGTLKPVPVRRVNVFLLNTKDGKAFLPVFTDMEELEKSFKKEDGAEPQIYTMKRVDDFLRKGGDKFGGMVLNPGTQGHLMFPKESVSVIAGTAIPVPQAAQQPAVPAPPVPEIHVTYGEPAVYPTRMDNAVYDLCRGIESVSRVWLKEKKPLRTIVLVVESDVKDDSILQQIQETAMPHAKDGSVEAVWYDAEAEEKIVQGAFAMYDREIDL